MTDDDALKLIKRIMEILAARKSHWVWRNGELYCAVCGRRAWINIETDYCSGCGRKMIRK